MGEPRLRLVTFLLRANGLWYDIVVFLLISGCLASLRLILWLLLISHLVYWMQHVFDSLMYILHRLPDVLHAVHQLAWFDHSPGPTHVAASDHHLSNLARTVDLTLIIGNWTLQDLKDDSRFHVYGDASHKSVELAFMGFPGIPHKSCALKKELLESFY